MIPDKNTNTARIPQNFETIDFGIDNEDFSHIVDILQNQLYSDKPLALVREYCCNAYDANVAAGKKDTPIHITLPSKFSPHLKIRDYGDGLSHDDMKLIFTRYGKSTKRGDNNTVGCFGIGSKCGFSYTNQFVVNSYQNGIKTAYSCVLTESKAGNLVVLSKSATNEANGCEVIINIKSDDTDTFRNICMKFFKHWEVMPVIEGFTAEDYASIKGTENIILSGDTWKIMYESNGWNRSTATVAIMGNVAYPINWNSVKGLDEMLKKRFDGDSSYHAKYFITDNSFVLKFGIGEIKMSPSRESLQYTDLTNAALIKRVEQVFDEVAKQAQIKMDACKNLWDAKKAYDNMFNGFSGLNRLRGSIKVTFQGKIVDNNQITGFDKFGTEHEAILKIYHRRNSNTNHHAYSCGKYSWNYIECGDKRMILEIDQTEKVYIQKAIKYLAANKNVSTVYVFQFKDDAQRKTVFDATGLDDSFITKYSTISDAVKQSIVRNTGGGTSVIVKKDTTVRSLRYYSSKNGDYSWRYNKVNELATKEVDMADGGIYVETNDNNVVGSMTFNAITNIVSNLGKYTNGEVKVHFIGQNLVNGKLMKNGKWIKFADYVNEKAQAILKKDSMLGLLAALEQLIRNEEVFAFESEFIKLIKPHDICDELTNIFNLQTTKKDVEKAIVSNSLNVDENDLKVVKGWYDVVKQKFPLIRVLNNSMSYHTTDSDEIVKYLKANA